MKPPVSLDQAVQPKTDAPTGRASLTEGEAGSVYGKPADPAPESKKGFFGKLKDDAKEVMDAFKFG